MPADGATGGDQRAGGGPNGNTCGQSIGDGVSQDRRHCLPPDQRVLTQDGYRPIAELDVRDTVITATGHSRLVTRIHCRDANEPLYHLRTARGNLLRTTGDHPVLARPDEGRPRWVPAADLRAGHLVAILGGTVFEGGARGHRPRPDPAPRSGAVATVLREEGAVYLAVDWVPLVAADAAPYAGLVYDLDVEEDHSFISGGMVCGGWAHA